MKRALIATIAHLATSPDPVSASPLFALYREADRLAQLAYLAGLIAIRTGAADADRERIERIYKRLTARATRRREKWQAVNAWLNKVVA